MGVIARLLEKRASAQTGMHPSDPAYWVQKLFGGGAQTDSGMIVDENTALTLSSVWAAVNIISGAVGFLPLIVYKRLDRGKERAPRHPSYKTLHDRANPYMDVLTFRETLQAHALTWGNGYAEIERDGAGRVKWYWPLRPDLTTPKVTKDGTLFYEVRKITGGLVNLPYENVLHIKGLGFDGLRGYSVIHQARESLGLGLAVRKYGAKFFSNGSTPTGVLEHPGKLSAPAAENLRSSWEGIHKGLDNAHRPGILEEGMKWTAIGLPPEDAQFLKTQRFGVNDVSRWFSIPPHMIGDLERSTFSNIEHQGIEFVTWTLDKWLKRWENEVNFKAFSTANTEFFAEFLTAALLRGDTKTRTASYKAGREGGWLSVNDIRAMENQNPIPDGDIYLQPLNMKEAGTQDDESDESQGDETDDENQDDEATRSLVEDTCRRLTTKERNVTAKILAKPDKLTEFYVQFRNHMIEVLEPVLRVCCNDDLEAETIAQTYTEARLQQFQDGNKATEPDPLELAGMILDGETNV